MVELFFSIRKENEDKFLLAIRERVDALGDHAFEQGDERIRQALQLAHPVLKRAAEQGIFSILRIAQIAAQHLAMSHEASRICQPRAYVARFSVQGGLHTEIIR